MKNLIIGFAAIAATLVACGGGNDAAKDISGEWKLVAFTAKDGEDRTTDCDKQTVWTFTEEAGEPLGDGTEVMKLTAVAPEDCQYYGFDAKWTVKDGKLFISTSNVGGMGGSSNAGLFTIVEQSPTNLELEIMGNNYKFSK